MTDSLFKGVFCQYCDTASLKLVDYPSLNKGHLYYTQCKNCGGYSHVPKDILEDEEKLFCYNYSNYISRESVRHDFDRYRGNSSY